MLLEGGSIINGAFQKAGVINELSLVVAPIVAKAEDKSLFYDSDISTYRLMRTTVLKDQIMWMQYKK